MSTYVCPECCTPVRGAQTCRACGLDLDSVDQLPTEEEFALGGVEAARRLREREAERQEMQARAEQPVPALRSPRVRGQVLQLWLVGGVIVDIAWGVLSVIHLGLLEDAPYRNQAKVDELVASDDRLVLLGIAAIVVFLVTSVFFIAWFHRAYKNLPALGCFDRRHALGWTIGAWFIPIVAWIIPKRIADDIWRCSVARSEGPELHWQLRSVPWWVHAWWGLYILGTFLGNVSLRVYGEGDDLDAERTSTMIDIVSVPIWIAAAILAWLVVDRISKAQDAAAAREG